MIIGLIIGVTGGAIAGLTYVTTMYEDNLEAQSAEWAGIHGPLTGADEWDIEFHKNWCTSNNGVWFETTECKWKDVQDRRNAFDNYKLTQAVVISGELAEQICDTMEIPCPENVTFDGSQTIKTGEIRYEGSNLGKIYNFKIIDGQLSHTQDGNT